RSKILRSGGTGELDEGESKTTTHEDANREAPDAGRAEAGWPQRMPALPRAESAAPRVRELWLLPRPASAGRGRRVGPLPVQRSGFTVQGSRSRWGSRAGSEVSANENGEPEREREL